MPGAIDGYSSSIVYKLTSLSYTFCIRYDYLQDQNSAGRLFKELMFCTQYAFLPAFLRFVQNVWNLRRPKQKFFLGLLCMHEFFSLNFPSHELFSVLRPTPPPQKKNFSNGPSLTLLFKQVEASDLNDYRPISVISVIVKVFERIVYDQLYNFLSDEDIISTHQSGFPSLHSTVTAPLEATDNWAFNMDRSNVNPVVFRDFKKGI